MSKCIKCGKEVSDEEFQKRYREILAQGITPSMVTICQECRDRITETVKFQLTNPDNLKVI